AVFAGQSAVLELRGRGLMIGVVLDRPCGELVRLALDEGLLINVTAGSVIRLLPPLILSNEQADDLVKRLGDLVLAWLDANATQVTD
ncbi:aminotransferase class III-fold pyridoxal phosphate-dependent enzyme, partial [Halothiobacillus sp.]|uniref:aminotransferase class III-fold pyridoxal phosphate-dependent enzyme n=1 Tax=Halothiobacillus sp. TaxID=1891311 RepID=UPI0026275963